MAVTWDSAHENLIRISAVFIGAAPKSLLNTAGAAAGWACGGIRPTVVRMKSRVVLAALVVLLAGTVLVGCGAAGGPTTGAARPSAAARAAGTSAAGGARAVRPRAAAAPVYGPVADPACAAAEKAEQTLQSRQGADQNDESALDQDFTNFASALSAAAQREKHPATAQAMTALANDYTDLVESQSGAAQLPDMTQVQKDGAAFDKACS
jgi:hypothetical protein